MTAYCEICEAEATELCAEHATSDSFELPLDEPPAEEFKQLRDAAANDDKEMSK